MRAWPIAAVVGLACACSPKLDNGNGDPGEGTHFDTGISDGNAFDGAHDTADPDAENFPDGPPPQLDAGVEDFGTAPNPSAHVDAVIDSTGGAITGNAGSPLAGVVLTIPAGALNAPTRIAIDLVAPPPLPNGATGITAFVDVGPAGTLFATPATLTLPYVTAASPLNLAMLARVGGAWGALVDPSASFSGATISASMRRASGAIGILATSIGAPKVTSISPSTASVGDVVFVEGTGFSLAPIATTSATSSIAIGGISAQILGWSDTELSFAIPLGATSGAVTVTTPGGSSASDPITIQ